MDAAVEARDLRHSYGETAALEGVSLEIGRGEVFGLIGPNGAGKTTLVRAVTGTVPVESGRVRLFGRPPEAIDRGRLGVLPQSFRPPERLTARELCGYYGGLYDGAHDADTVLEAVGLTDRGDSRYEHLSGGERRRLCVGIAIVNDPEVLVLDEPTTGIDPAGRRTVWSLVERLANAGTTVILTTHDMAEAAELADRVGLLADGHLLARGPPASLVEDHGGPSRVTVETDAPPAAFEDLEWPVATRDGAVVLEGVAPTELGAVVTALEGAGVTYRGLTWTEPDLESVYFALAGDREGAAGDRVGAGVTP